MSTREQWEFALLLMFGAMGWLLWLMSLSREWFLVGFANWFVRRLFVLAQIATAIANAASYGLVEYRRIRSKKFEPLHEYVEVQTRS
jgi:hypothetical protein